MTAPADPAATTGQNDNSPCATNDPIATSVSELGKGMPAAARIIATNNAGSP